MIDKATMDFITQVVKAELAAKSKSSDIQAQQDADRELSVLGFHEGHTQQAFQAAHENAMQAQQQAHEQSIAQQQAQAAAASQASDQIHQQNMAEQAPQGAD